jgi:TATA-box binding protein (TBP) (component of TFIID and TFIIIB)
MDSIFDELTSYICENENAISTYVDDIQTSTADIANVNPEVVTVKQVRQKPEKKSYKRIKPKRNGANLLQCDLEKSIANLFEEDHMMTALINTTNTVEGKLIPLTFKEEDMIKLCYYTDDVLDVACNFGNVRHPDYYRAKRVNKKKNKLKKRKEQGNGTEFNSQITFTIKSNGPNPYLFKVFRPGQIQLPGAKIDALADIIRCSNILTAYINKIYNRTDIALENLSAVMKNYKCVAKLPPKCCLNLAGLMKLLHGDRVTNGIFMIKYSRQDSKAAVIFNTPTANDKEKRARVNIFASGKINILGAFDEEYTRHMYNVIYTTIKNNFDAVTIQPDSRRYAWNYNLSVVDPITMLDDLRLHKTLYGYRRPAKEQAL